MQTSTDLVNWTYLPIVESGVESVDGIQFTSTAIRQFWRLKYTDAPVDGSAQATDFDNDRISNSDELGLGTDPFNMDSDGDGFHDGDERDQHSDPVNAAQIPIEFIEQENDAMTEKPVFLFDQGRQVSNDWYKYGSDIHGSVQWSDDTGENDHEDYDVFEPRWQDKLGLVSYPSPDTNPQTWTYVGSHSLGTGSLHVLEDDLGISTGSASLLYRRAALACAPAEPAGQPWPVVRRYFACRETRPYGGGSAVYSNARMHLFSIPKDQKVCLENNRVLLEPPLVSEKSITDHVALVQPTAYQSLALDDTGLEHWLMVPAGNVAQMVLLPYHPSGLSDVAFHVHGGTVSPAVSTYSSHPFYTPFISNTVGEDSSLHVSVAGATAAEPLLRFAVKPRRTLTIHIRPIALISGNMVWNPFNIPTEAEAKSYLDSVFGVQTNVYIDVEVLPLVPVAYDVGLGLFGANEGVGNKELDLFSGYYAKKNHDSAEETLILNSAPSAQEASITVYWVASSPRMNQYAWPDAAGEEEGNLKNWRKKAVNGSAAKAMGSPPSRIIWICGLPAASGEPPMLWTLAHEIAHALGNIGHSIESYALERNNLTSLNSVTPYSGNHKRLMTGMGGPRRTGGPRRLIKYEWDQIHNFAGYDP